MMNDDDISHEQAMRILEKIGEITSYSEGTHAKAIYKIDRKDGFTRIRAVKDAWSLVIGAHFGYISIHYSGLHDDVYESHESGMDKHSWFVDQISSMTGYSKREVLEKDRELISIHKDIDKRIEALYDIMTNKYLEDVIAKALKGTSEGD